ncbi:hypothetical protein [Bifidobacterium stellenboschense]|uniref:Uncharacterized protein n=1 Tax=Bifidobacterium stellenboschense TaxID=762211 RepID=A0A087DQI0_9BIFI|nr:hypothetical protein [Bifidobacterium stellenboschense]KFI97780.1 hypothetical protein BSTEL_0591 [Bifidobacterium stellenboschense]
MSQMPVEHVRRIAVTRTSADGVVSHTEVRITETRVVDVDSAADAGRDMGDVGECFDPATCCSEREQAMIAALRAYLRPESAPECLKARLKACLDHCCEQ